MLVPFQTGVISAYWLFSQKNMTGSFQRAARLRDSWKVPWLVAPSPKNVKAAWSEPEILAPKAAPTAMGMAPPTMPLAPKLPR